MSQNPTPEQLAKYLAQNNENEALLRKLKGVLVNYEEHLGIDMPNLTLLSAVGYAALAILYQTKFVADQVAKELKEEKNG